MFELAKVRNTRAQIRQLTVYAVKDRISPIFNVDFNCCGHNADLDLLRSPKQIEERQREMML